MDQVKDLPPTKDLSPENQHRISEISTELNRVNKGIRNGYEADSADWIKTSKKIVNSMYGLSEWDGPVLTSLDTIFTKGLNEVKTDTKDDEKAVQHYINNWHGWVGEAAFMKLFDQFNAGKLKRDEESDAEGVDGKILFANPKANYAIYLQIKSSRRFKPGVILFNPNETGYYTQIPGAEDGVTPSTVIRESYKYDRLKGKTWKYCQDDSEIVRKNILATKKYKPKDYASFAILLVAGIGMENQDEEKYYGWKELMKIVYLDKIENGNRLANAVKTGIPKFLSKAKPIK